MLLLSLFLSSSPLIFNIVDIIIGMHKKHISSFDLLRIKVFFLCLALWLSHNTMHMLYRLQFMVWTLVMLVVTCPNSQLYSSLWTQHKSRPSLPVVSLSPWFSGGGDSPQWNLTPECPPASRPHTCLCGGGAAGLRMNEWETTCGATGSRAEGPWRLLRSCCTQTGRDVPAVRPR